MIPEFYLVTFRLIQDALKYEFYEHSPFCHVKLISNAIHINTCSLLVLKTDLLVPVFIAFWD